MNPGITSQAGQCEWIGLAVLALASVLYAMDLTVLYLAIPSLSAALQPTSAQLLWIVDIYGFLIAGSLITMGTLGDQIGRRKLLLIGATVLALLSIAALAWRCSFAIPLVWLFNLWGTIDLLYGYYNGIALQIDPGSFASVISRTNNNSVNEA